VNGPKPAAGAVSAMAMPAGGLRSLAQSCGVLLRPPRAQLAPPPRRAIAAIVVAAGLAVAAMFVVDKAATDWARHLTQGFHDAFEQITNAGLSGWFLVPFGVAFLLLTALASSALPRLTRALFAVLAARFGFLFLAIALPGLFTNIVKRLIGRARPYMDIRGNPFTYRPLGWDTAYASFPSGHATTVGAAAFAIGALWPRSRLVMWLYALLIMFSRVVVLAHHPSDVIAGALVGAFGAALLRRWFAARRLVFSPRTLAALPEPTVRRLKTAFRQLVFRP
jgi:membrane-associated phospholipid phosphatase